jgi:hypothetical protein
MGKRAERTEDSAFKKAKKIFRPFSRIQPRERIMIDPEKIGLGASYKHVLDVGKYNMANVIQNTRGFIGSDDNGQVKTNCIKIQTFYSAQISVASALKAHLRDNYYATLNSDDDISAELELLIPPDDYVVTELDEHPQLLPEGITREQWEAIPEQQPRKKADRTDRFQILTKKVEFVQLNVRGNSTRINSEQQPMLEN